MYSRLATVIALVLALAVPAWGESLVVVRSAALKPSPDLLARPVSTLSVGTEVTALERRGGWQRVGMDDGSQGWLRHYQVRRGVAPSPQGSDGGRRGVLSGLATLSRSATGLLGGGSSSDGSSGTATIGVRGLTAEEIKQAQADVRQLIKLELYKAEVAAARGFADAQGLVATRLAFITAAPAAGPAEQPAPAGPDAFGADDY